MTERVAGMTERVTGMTERVIEMTKKVMLISIIAAIGKNRELGKNNQLLWKIPKDLERFKKITLNHPVIMGRTTYESIGKPLPYRKNIIITRNLNYKAACSPGSKSKITIVHSLEEAIANASKHDHNEIFIIGGGQIYEQGVKYADKLYLTIVKGKYEADTFFPEYSEFNKVILKKAEKDDKYEFTFYELTK